MKQFKVFSVFLLFMAAGAFSVHAQDLIILRDGNIIEARVTEISSSEIRYRRFDHLTGPVIVLPAANVLTIRYEGGRTQIINPNPARNTQQSNRSATPANYSAMDPYKFNFGLSLNPAGLIPGAGGLSLTADFTKGRFNCLIDLRSGFGIPHTDIFGAGVSFNHFWHSRIGGFYLGGMIDLGLGFEGLYGGSYEDYFYSYLGASINIGYKFVTQSGMYFRIGGNLGVGMYSDSYYNSYYDEYYDNTYVGLIFRPSLTIGYIF